MGVRKIQEKIVCKVCGGAQKGVQIGMEPGFGGVFVGACLSDRAYCDGIGGEKGGWWVPRAHKVVHKPLIGH